MISHELKTPLTVIRGYSALLKSKSLEKIVESQKIAGVASEIEENSYLLEKMVNDLLEFSRLESGSLKYEKEIFTLGEMLNFIRSISTTHQKTSECEYTELILRSERQNLSRKHTRPGQPFRSHTSGRDQLKKEVIRPRQRNETIPDYRYQGILNQSRY